MFPIASSINLTDILLAVKDIIDAIVAAYPLPVSQRERPLKARAASITNHHRLESMDRQVWCEVRKRGMFNHIIALINYSDPETISVEVSLCIAECHENENKDTPEWTGSPWPVHPSQIRNRFHSTNRSHGAATL